jgi:hypothetical protein
VLWFRKVRDICSFRKKKNGPEQNEKKMATAWMVKQMNDVADEALHAKVTDFCEL